MILFSVSSGSLNECSTYVNHSLWKELIIENSFQILLYMYHTICWMKISLYYDEWWFILLTLQSLAFHVHLKYFLFITSHNLFRSWNIFVVFVQWITHVHSMWIVITKQTLYEVYWTYIYIIFAYICLYNYRYI